MSSRLGEILRRRGLLAAEQLALAMATEHPGPLAGELARLGLVAEDVLVDALADEYGLQVVEPSAADVPRAALDAVPHALARRHLVVPVALDGSMLTVAMIDPTMTVAIAEVKFLCGLDVRVAVARVSAVRELIDRLYGDAPELADALAELGPVEPVIEHGDDRALDEAATAQAPVVRFVNALLAEAAGRRASDIHIEPYADTLRVRLRVDGVLCELAPPPSSLAGAITNRVKVMAQLDIAERRLPQDGRLRLRLADGGQSDVRVSVLPTIFGETLVLRLLDCTRLDRRLDTLGLDHDALALLRDALARPHGLVLATGPTGSGKTTTLYAALAALDTAAVNVCTVEDPVEVHLRGVNQVHAREDVGLSFGIALRALLRQDPDVIMVGEIRDLDTADIAVKAALTGHLVLSTLHTNDAASAITRLLDMGIPPFLVAGSLVLIVAQRLVRLVCVHCHRDRTVQADVLRAAGWRGGSFRARRGDGCRECAGSGYRGRTAVYELMPIGDLLRERIVAGASALELGRIARADGMRTLRQSALALAAGGVTSIEEVLRVTPADADATC
jgi:type IV pilus assembly protein PilB